MASYIRNDDKWWCFVVSRSIAERWASSVLAVFFTCRWNWLEAFAFTRKTNLCSILHPNAELWFVRQPTCVTRICCCMWMWPLAVPQQQVPFLHPLPWFVFQLLKDEIQKHWKGHLPNPTFPNTTVASLMLLMLTELIYLIFFLPGHHSPQSSWPAPPWLQYIFWVPEGKVECAREMYHEMHIKYSWDLSIPSLKWNYKQILVLHFDL